MRQITYKNNYIKLYFKKDVINYIIYKSNTFEMYVSNLRAWIDYMANEQVIFPQMLFLNFFYR